MVEKLARLYEDTIRENIEFLTKLEKQLYGKISYNQIVKQSLEESTKNLTQKWISEKKYLRTKYARDAIPNYPQKTLKLSVILDANINLMDDILDEDLSKKEKGLYLVELLRVMALRDSYKINGEAEKRISNYFNKIIFVAISEQIFLEQMKQTSGEKFYEIASDYFKGRGLDMDIFLELPLHERGYQTKEIEEVLKAGRIFRTINLMKKDLIDLEHDLKTGIETPITLLQRKKQPIHDFIDYVFSNSMSTAKTKSSQKTETIVHNLLHLSLQDQKDIKSLTKK
ncbi:MAG: hypothetical protein GF334_07435 [Candidatus Altiarchaeales archaeon]|nr:hypothetical protein [Candidatus Altiarchaeales archaeon]